MANTQKVPAAAGPISSFAHLAGVLAAKADKDTDEKDDEKDRKKDEKEDKEAKGAKSEMDEDAACDDSDRPDDEPTKKGKKKAKAEKEKDTSDDDSDYDDHKAQHARHAERARIHAIMTCKGAKHALKEAEWLAFNTDTPAGEAIGNLNVMAIEKLTETATAAREPQKRDALRDRMAGVEQPDIGAGAEGGGTGDAYQDQVRTTAAAIVAAGKKRRGEKA